MKNSKKNQKSKSEMIHDKAKIRSAKKFYYDAKNPRKTEKQKLLLHYKKKIVLFCEDSVSVSDENNVLCCPLRTKLC